MSDTGCDFYAHDLLDVCQRLHGDACGSGSVIQEDEHRKLVAWLELRLANWQPPSIGRWSHYESCVQNLCLATLSEVYYKYPRQ